MMKHAFIILLAALALNAQAQPPAARLEVAGQSLSGQITKTPLFVLPSCEMLSERLRYLQKQSEEMGASIQTLHEVRRGMLIIADQLRRPWMDVRAVYPLESLPADVVQAVQVQSYGVSYDLEGRLWSSQQAFLPDGVSIAIADNKLSLRFSQTGLEYCYPKNGIWLSLLIH